jgi:hypothetical protein
VLYGQILPWPRPWRALDSIITCIKVLIKAYRHTLLWKTFPLTLIFFMLRPNISRWSIWRPRMGSCPFSHLIDDLRRTQTDLRPKRTRHFSLRNHQLLIFNSLVRRHLRRLDHRKRSSFLPLFSLIEQSLMDTPIVVDHLRIKSDASLMVNFSSLDSCLYLLMLLPLRSHDQSTVLVEIP